MKTEKIRNIIISVLEEINNVEEIKDDTDLLETGAMDSFTILLLISELEESLNIQIPIHDVTENTFKTINSITMYVNSKIGG